MSRPAAIDYTDVMALANAGHTAQQIADTLGCDRSWVYKLAADLGLTITRGPGPNRTPDDVRDRVRELAAAGVPQVKIAAEVGRSASWVAMFLRGKR